MPEEVWQNLSILLITGRIAEKSVSIRYTGVSKRDAICRFQ